MEFEWTNALSWIPFLSEIALIDGLTMELLDVNVAVLRLLSNPVTNGLYIL